MGPRRGGPRCLLRPPRASSRCTHGELSFQAEIVSDATEVPTVLAFNILSLILRSARAMTLSSYAGDRAGPARAGVTGGNGNS